MKNLANQAVIQHIDLSRNASDTGIQNKYTAKQKVFLVAKALHEFHQDIDIPYKLCFKAFIFTALFIASVVTFPMLLVRALDIEAEERQQIILDHEQYLNIKLKNDAPQEKGEH